MDRLGRLGSVIYGVALVGLGLVSLIRRDAIPDLEPLPASLPMRSIVALFAAVLLLAAGTALVAHWQRVRAAGTVGVLFSMWLVALFVPRLVSQPQNGGIWVVFWEVAALGAAAWSLASPRVAHGARIAFGLAFLAFGMSHFVYHGYVESVIPGWIPFHVFFAYATGVAHLAAGISLLTRVREQLATALLAVMFGSWVVLVHVPRVVASPRSANEWTSLFVAVAMCGAALIVRSTLPEPQTALAPAAPRMNANPLLKPWRSHSSRHSRAE